LRSFLLVKETGENHQPAVSHWQTLSHNVVSSTPPSGVSDFTILHLFLVLDLICLIVIQRE
jgi:hypothetical protein